MSHELSAKRQILEGVQTHLVREGRLLQLPGGLIVGPVAAERLASAVADGPERFDIAAFKERFGLSRKWAIPWLEHLDERGVTRREGDERVLVKPMSEEGETMSESKTIAVVGASTDRTKFGNKCVRAYQHAGWTVYPVNPKANEIEGLEVYASLDDVDVTPDRISVYLPPALTREMIPVFARKEGAELWLNPGAANPEVAAEARAAGIDVHEACSIVDIGLSPSMFR